MNPHTFWHPSGVLSVPVRGPGVSRRSTPGYCLPTLRVGERGSPKGWVGRRSNPEGCQTVAGGRCNAKTSGREPQCERHPGGVPERRHNHRPRPFESWILKFGFSALLFLVAGGAAFAQPAPHLAYVYPAGGRTGAVFQVTVGGQNLLTASNAFISGPGVTATVLDRTRPMNQKDFNDLRDQLKVLREKFQDSRKGGTNVWTETDAAEREEVRAKILRNPPNRTAAPAMLDTVTLRVAIAADAPPGDREIRLGTPTALSNPFRFCVGTLPEVSKPAARPANPDFDKFLETLGGKPLPAGTPKYEGRLTPPALANGQIMPGGVDRYRFFATEGQSLVLAISARQLIPYLADAVPGWFEPVLTIFDDKGRELVCEERFHFKPDPVIHLAVPHNGEYTVEIHDSIFRGRQDFVYRLAIGELPFVTAINPLGGRLGEKTTVTLTGWNLASSSLIHDNIRAGITALTGDFFNAVPFIVDDLPESSALETADSVETAQAVTLPVILNGRISRPGVGSVFQFTGRAGQNIVAEIFARRLDSPLDSFLRLTDAAGKQLAFNDDFEDKGSGLDTGHADSYLTATLPADGSYYLHLTDTQGKGGPDFAYRLRLSEPRPDFALRLVPSSLSLRTGMSTPVTVWALRRDGFTNAINLELKDAPPGFSLSGARIAAGKDQVQFTLKAPSQPLDSPVSPALDGSAQIGGKLVTRDAVPAEDMLQAFFYRQLVPSKELLVTVAGPARPFLANAFKILSATPVKIPSGGTARVRVSAPSAAFLQRYDLELNNAPAGISLTGVSTTPGGVELMIAGEADTLTPGSTGNLICDVVPKPTAAANPAKKAANPQRRGAVATLPAIPYVVSTE